MTVVLAAGCGGASEQAEPPEPETVMVTVEKTVEKTVQAAAQPSTASGTTTSSAPDSADITCEVGQVCDLGGSTVTVTRVQETRGVQNLGETLEGYFVVVDFDYAQYEEAPVDTEQPPFQLSDSAGNTYSLNTTATIAYGVEAGRSLVYTTVQPGVTAPGAAVFEVSPEAEGFTLLVKDLLLPDTRKTAKVPL